MIRLASALFMAPFLVLALYLLGYSAIMFGSGVEVSLVASFVVLLPFAYLATVVIWLPIVVIFEWRKQRGFWKYATAGAVVGIVSGGSALYFWGNNFTVEVFFIGLVHLLLGATFGAIFWVGAFFTGRPTQR